jgi:hypothetical protein
MRGDYSVCLDAAAPSFGFAAALLRFSSCSAATNDARGSKKILVYLCNALSLAFRGVL